MPAAKTKDVRKARRAVKHGAYTTPEVLRVPEKYTAIYQEYVNEERPFDLRRELALLRVLHVRMEEALLNKGHHKVRQIADEIKDRLLKIYDEKTDDKDKLEHVMTTCALVSTEVIKNTFELSSLGIGLEDLADHIEKISRVAERMKKIQEGVKLQVSIDTNILVKFIQEVVFHFVQDRRTRQQIIERASMMAVPNRPTATALPVSPRRELTPEEINPLGDEVSRERVEVPQVDIPLEDML